MKKCKICGEELNKKKNTEHYGCRNASEINAEEVGTLSKSTYKSGMKAMKKKPGLIIKILRRHI